MCIDDHNNVSLTFFVCSLRDRAILRLFMLLCYVGEWSRTLCIWLGDWSGSVSKMCAGIPLRVEQNNCQLKHLILTLFGFIFTGLYVSLMCIAILYVSLKNEKHWRNNSKIKIVESVKIYTSKTQMHNR